MEAYPNRECIGVFDERHTTRSVTHNYKKV